MDGGAMIDRGVQIERTRLAWKRTLLATGVLCCAAIRALSYLDSRWGVACACGVVLFAAECVVYWLRRSRYESWFLAVDRRGAADRPPGGGGLAVVAGCLGIVSFSSLALVLMA
ncbi:DUF202 domain-containing protein [Bifidobacterium scardovii]|nr:DUF202 domain-containing protein [Bifidobacterium scardovii]MDK6349296.1 DUF202 domain-containing protein [Bifidobacterium scardovii]MDU8980633.1 DUF202 domain-containing protein [Bifidobacterium scardovii]